MFSELSEYTPEADLDTWRGPGLESQSKRSIGGRTLMVIGVVVVFVVVVRRVVVVVVVRLRSS